METSNIEMHAEWAGAYRTLPRSKTDQEFNCKDCGLPVRWAVSSKTGKTYLAQEATWMSDSFSSLNGRTNIRTFFPVHKCEPNAEYQARYAKAMEMIEADRVNKLEAGELVVGAHVVVARGRKIAKGTEGTLFWIAPEADAYGTVRAGFTTTDGEKVFINIANLEVQTSTTK